MESCEKGDVRSEEQAREERGQMRWVFCGQGVKSVDNYENFFNRSALAGLHTGGTYT